MRVTMIFIVALTTACAAESETTERTQLGSPRCSGWEQIFGAASHAGKVCSEISGLSVLARVETDPSARREHNAAGFLAVHYGAPLTSMEWAYIPVKRGYTSLSRPGTQTWGVEARRWHAGALALQWRYESKFKPVDAISPGFGGLTSGYEQLFQPALVISAGVPTTLYVPSEAGTLDRVDPLTGARLGVVNPLAGTAFDGDQGTVVSSALSVGPDGSVYYTVVAWPLNGNPSTPPRAAWLVRVLPTGLASVTSWASIASASLGIPQKADQCSYPYAVQSPQPPRPWPPSPTAPPFRGPCGGQRPTINAAPTIADGKVLVLSTDNNATSHAYVIAVDVAAMTPVWAASLRGQILDGCGVLVPYGTDPFACRPGTTLGFDLNFNEPVAGRETGLMELTPMVAPDGTVYVGSYSGGYDDNRGHLHHFSDKGSPLGVYKFGWETTPFAFVHDGTFSLVMDNNRTTDGTDSAGVFAHARLSPSMTVESEFVVTNRATEANDMLNGQGAVDVVGNSYALNANGTLTKVSPTSTALETVELGVDLEPLSSELSWGQDDAGRQVLYVPFAGSVFAVGGRAP